MAARTPAFQAAKLISDLALIPLADSPVPILSDAERVVVKNLPAAQLIQITCHADDLGTPAFTQFVKKAASAHHRFGLDLA